MSIERKSDRWISLTQSVLLHGLVVGGLVYGFYAYKHKPPAPTPTLAVEANVVEQKSSAPPPKAPEPPPPEPTPPPPPEDVGPPEPSPEEVQQREQAERDAELRKTLEAEERADKVRSSGVMNSWIAQIANKVQRSWNRPQSARAGLECVVRVTQTPGGEVTGVSVGDCNGDAAVRASIESAVYRASPLPPAPDPAVFDRNLVFTFKPSE
jgi:outer membrane biosynthesis protein TonB